MALDPEARLLAARRIIAAALGDDKPDGELIKDYGIGIADGAADTVWILGELDDSPPSHFSGHLENIAHRLADAFDRLEIARVSSRRHRRCVSCDKLVSIATHSDSGLYRSVQIRCGAVCIGCMVVNNSPLDLPRDRTEADRRGVTAVQVVSLTRAEEWFDRQRG
ncbi:hypothetical protein ABZ894_21620 [Nocardia beijingensis]|uniref:hypothetical protein n=1 Tax=Nocardia beijingensis TaxID=95162 RepID=UPI003409157F